MSRFKFRLMAALTVPLLLSACAGTRPVAYRSIASAPLLTKNKTEDTHIALVYVAPDVELATYKQISIDPVSIYDGPDQQFGSMPLVDRNTIAAYIHDAFSKAAAIRFRLTDAPGPDTLRMHIILAGAETNTPVLATLTKLVPGAVLMNLVQGARGKEGSFAGSVSFAVEIYDSGSNRLLEAYVSKQFPFAENIGASLGSLAATKVGVDQGAADLLPVLARLAADRPPA